MQESPKEPVTIERVTAPSAELFQSRYLGPGRPVVIAGAVQDWPALGRWSAARLKSIREREPIPVDVYEDGDFFAIGGAIGHRKRIHLPLAQYLDAPASATGPRYYAPDLELRRFFPELARDVTVPSLLPGQAQPRLFLFAGRDAITAGHFHPFTHALTCQVTGRKRVVLYPPKARLYPHPWFSPAFHWSRANLLDPDYERFPELKRVRPLDCTLEPGDAIFIPVHWWHWTQGLDFSVSVLVSWKAALRSWHFPRPGMSCLFARLVWPGEELLRAVAAGAKRAVRPLSWRS